MKNAPHNAPIRAVPSSAIHSGIVTSGISSRILVFWVFSKMKTSASTASTATTTLPGVSRSPYRFRLCVADPFRCLRAHTSRMTRAAGTRLMGRFPGLPRLPRVTPAEGCQVSAGSSRVSVPASASSSALTPNGMVSAPSPCPNPNSSTTGTPSPPSRSAKHARAASRTGRTPPRSRARSRRRRRASPRAGAG